MPISFRDASIPRNRAINHLIPDLDSADPTHAGTSTGQRPAKEKAAPKGGRI